MCIDQVDGGWDFDGWVDDGGWWLCGLMMEGWVLIRLMVAGILMGGLMMEVGLIMVVVWVDNGRWVLIVDGGWVLIGLMVVGF